MLAKRKFTHPANAFLAYAVGMGVLAATSLYLCQEVAQGIAAQAFATAQPDAAIAKVSRVEKHLRRLEAARWRVARAAHPPVLAYRVPEMRPAALAMALDRSEHAQGNTEVALDYGVRVAGYLGLAADHVADDNPSNSGETGQEASRSETALAAGPIATMSAKTKADGRKGPSKSGGAAAGGRAMRVAETPGEIIHRQLGGTNQVRRLRR